LKESLIEEGKREKEKKQWMAMKQKERGRTET